MEESKNQKVVDKNKEKSRLITKKQYEEEKKTKSDANSKKHKPESEIENIMVVGKSCNLLKLKMQEPAFHLHECRSETALNKLSDNPKLTEDIPHEGSALPFSSLSCASFISAQSDVSNGKTLLRGVQGLDHDLCKMDVDVMSCDKSSCRHGSSLQISLNSQNDYASKLKDMERKLVLNEEKLLDLNKKLEECNHLKSKKILENRDLTHQINILNRQLQSMYELVGQKSWNNNANPIEFLLYKNKATELESLIEKLQEDKRILKENITTLSTDLGVKEKELNSKSKELVDYKNRTTLEICKLINKIDCLKRTMKIQSEQCDGKITEAQNLMDDELVKITTKLEDQYQKDLKCAIEKVQSHFERFAILSPTTIERLLEICETDKFDCLPSEDKEIKKSILSGDITAEITNLKDHYEEKIKNLNHMIECLTAELMEKNKILEIYKSELEATKKNPSLSSLISPDDVENFLLTLKDLYAVEINAQKKVHKLEIDVFEERVKALSDEILYRAKNEEAYFLEVENARKMARLYREKYEQFVLEWGEGVQKKCESFTESKFSELDLDDLFEQIQILSDAIKAAEDRHEKSLKKMKEFHENELIFYANDVEIFKSKLQEMEIFQKDQLTLDTTIRELIENVATNYVQTVEALVTSHATELSLKQLEMYTAEKKFTDEINSMKTLYHKEVKELEEKLREAVESSQLNRPNAADYEEMSLRLLKYEGMLAIKEETENALINRIEEMENLFGIQRENCRKEMENLMGKLVERNVVSSAKDDLAKELEEKLNDSEKLIEESCKNINDLYGICSVLGENKEIVRTRFKGIKVIKTLNDFAIMKNKCKQLKVELVNSLDKIEVLQKEISTLKCTKSALINSNHEFLENIETLENKTKALAKEKKNVMEEKEKIQLEYDSVLKNALEKDEDIKNLNKKLEEFAKINESLLVDQAKLKDKLEVLTAEKEELSSKKAMIEEKNRTLQKELEFANKEKKSFFVEREKKQETDDEEIKYSGIKLEKYDDKTQLEQELASNESDGCQVKFLRTDHLDEPCTKKNETLLKENEFLKNKLSEMKCQDVMNTDIILNFEKKLSNAINEKNDWIAISKNLETEKQNLRKALENLREANSVMEKKFEAQIRMLEEKNLSHPKEKVILKNAVLKKGETAESSAIPDHEKIGSMSLDHLRNSRQNSSSDVEEIRRRELEGQPAKVPKENALQCHFHRTRLEENGRKTSNSMTESQPSVASWTKIHETVENIVDEVLALKTSFVESEPVPGTCTDCHNRSNLKLMSETVRSQLQNKTILCDELLIQKKTLECELRELEELLKENDSRIMGQKRKRSSADFQKQHSKLYRFEFDEICRNEMSMLQMYGKSQFNTLTLLKKHLENSLEKTEFYENLKREMQGSKKEIQQLELNIAKKKNALEEMRTDEERDWTLIEIRYEEEILELMKEFEREVDKLRSHFSEGNLWNEKWEEDAREKYFCEIHKIREYFGRKHETLEKKYYEIYNALDKERLNCALEKERQQIINCFQKIFQTKEGKIQETELENFLNDIVNKYIEEIKSLRNMYKENLIEHASEIENLQSVILSLKKNSLQEDGKEIMKGEKTHLEKARLECEQPAENEKSKLLTILKEQPEKDNYWSRKLCKCQGTGEDARIEEVKYKKIENSVNAGSNGNPSDPEKCESNKMACNPNSLEFCVSARESGCRTTASPSTFGEKVPEMKSNLSFLAQSSYFDDNQVKTDDDKLDIIKERDSLKEMVFSLRGLVNKLLIFIKQSEKDFSDDTLRDFNGEDTLYKSVPINANDNQMDFSIFSQSGMPELSTIIQDIHNHSLLNSSEHIRLDLDRYLKKIKSDAVSLLSLSHPEGFRQILETVMKIEDEKNHLEEEVKNVEKNQAEIREEIQMTKDKLAIWERNLEVVSEGYGEEVIAPKERVMSSDLMEKMKNFWAESGCVPSSRDTAFLEELCRQGYLSEEEWKKEKFDLQQQIDVADKQLHSLRKFMEEQAAERELERDAFDKEINHLKESLKHKERDNAIYNKTSQKVDALESQIKELLSQTENLEESKNSIESEFQTAVKKIWTLREVIQDLETQLSECHDRESLLKRKIEKFDDLIQEQTKINSDLKEELEMYKNENEVKMADQIRNLEEERLSLRLIVDRINPDDLVQMKLNLRQIENAIIKKTKDLEQLYTSSANVSCSSPSEDVSIRDHFDATRCPTPDEMSNLHDNIVLPMEEIDRLQEKLSRHTRAEEAALKCINDLKMQLSSYKKSCEELLTERDVLLERMDVYLKENSSLKARLEEQRCNASLVQKKLNADLEAQIHRLQNDWEKLNELCIQKDKQLHDMEKMLDNTTKALNVRETEVLNKQKEENMLISRLKTDLTNALSDKETLKNDLETVKEKLRKSLKIPALIDSVIDEKNAEIDRLEKEVSRLSNEKSSLEMSTKNLTDSQVPKIANKIRFSEPESFEGCVSTISPYIPSIIRNCNDSFTDFRSTSFKIAQPLHHSKELESVSSIGPLQLSPRGSNLNPEWKTSSPITGGGEGGGGGGGDSIVDKSSDVFKNEAKLIAEIKSKETELLTVRKELDDVRRQLDATEEEKRELEKKVEFNNDEKISVESLNKKHLEEIEELQNKLNFERGKVEKVYNEIKELEVKKVEIEEAFYSLKREYKERSDRDQKMIKTSVEKIKELESKSTDSERKFLSMKNEMETVVKEANETMQVLYKELTDVKSENMALKRESISTADAAIQVENDYEFIENLTFELINWTKSEVESKAFIESPKDFKAKLNGLSELQTRKGGECTRQNIFTYFTEVKNLLSFIFENFNESFSELNSRKKKLLESSVDELAIKVQKELLLSEKLDDKLLSSIEGRRLKTENVPETGIPEFRSEAGGEAFKPNQENNKSFIKAWEEKAEHIEKEKEELLAKVENHEKIINFLEENLMAEKQRIIAEKERCKEDARIMELLRIKLEKCLLDIKSKDKDLKKEKQLRLALEKEMETLKKCMVTPEAQEEKLTFLHQSLENERKKTKELKLMIEQEKLERLSEKETQKLWESDFGLLKEQKENLKSELIKTKQLLHSRDKEINLLKRKINLQEIDIRALSLSNEFIERRASIAKDEEYDEVTSSSSRNHSSLSSTFNKSRNGLDRHIEDSNNELVELGHFGRNGSKETAPTTDQRALAKKLEESNDVKTEDETLLAEGELERKLWDLERGKLLMDVEALKIENDIVKRDSIETYKRNEFLQLENSKLKAEIQLLEKETTCQIEMKMLRDQTSQLLRKYLRAESYRKALVWQKQYLTINLNGYRASEEEILKKFGRIRSRKKEDKIRGVSRFRIISLSVIAVFRMKFIVKKWQKPKVSSAFQFHSQMFRDPKRNPAKEVVNLAYNDPLNPLAYQCQNLFRRAQSSRVLRSPPSRDPGLQSVAPEKRFVGGPLTEDFTDLKGSSATTS